MKLHRPVALAAACLLLFAAADADASRLRKRTRDRQVPDGWCPLEREDLLLFRADGPSALVRLTASNHPTGLGVDNVYVVAAAVIDQYLVDTQCADDIYGLSAPPSFEPFYEIFDLEVNGWRGSNAFFVSDSAPRLPFDDSFEVEGAGRSVLLHPNGFIETTVFRLVPGQFYYLGAWWWWDGSGPATLLLEVDTLDPAALYLNRGRFRVEAEWTRTGSAGVGTAVPLTDDTGWFWFFRPTNLEVVIKVLNGCSVNGRYWVFASGLTDVGVELTVTDTVRGGTFRIDNPRGKHFAPVLDTAAFATCP